jgi:hypothetical protein
MPIPTNPSGHATVAAAPSGFIGSVAAEPKLTDEDVERLRELDDEGWSLPDLAAEFDISPQHAGRLARGDQRPAIVGLGAEAAQSSVLEAVAAFLEGVDLNPGDAVLAATAKTLAEKLDACAVSSAASAAQAVPRLALSSWMCSRASRGAR